MVFAMGLSPLWAELWRKSVSAIDREVDLRDNGLAGTGQGLCVQLGTANHPDLL